jgi:hypothetical protein
MAAVGLTPSGTVIAEDVRDLQSWSNHNRRRYGAGGFSVSRFARLWRGAFRPWALDLGDYSGRHAGVASRRLELVVSKRTRVIMHLLLTH